ncbi:predicted protein [Arabidopsis lyrata subsp. lyrata]|uniref:Predicted protein n=1 Tax=Arabidopsis lyrata subsp. lyrata TaxID=81972 RepID=D7LWB3_ARALL|nr:predicted protein [Arabidopsis lyrata subsp. lyrata]
MVFIENASLGGYQMSLNVGYRNLIYAMFFFQTLRLHLGSVWFGEGDTGLLKLISGCHVLEELTMIHLWWGGYWNRSVSSKTLKRLTGLHHKHTIKCEDADGCLCKSSKEICSCLSSSPVKVLKILKFGEVSSYFDDEEKQLELVKYFLETMPNLEQMILCYNTRIDEGVKSQLERLVPRVSSSKCSVQLICDNFIAPTYPFYGIVPAPSYPVYEITRPATYPSHSRSQAKTLMFSFTSLSQSSSQYSCDFYALNKSLVKLRIGARNGLAVGGLIMKVGDVSLPKLKTLCLDSVVLDYQIICLAKLLSGCHVLEQLALVNLSWNFWEYCSVSIPTLKRLTCCIEEDWINPPPSVTFDNPALVYFEYTDTVALKYEKVNFDSLVEARLGLRVAYEETENPIEFPDGIPFPVIEYVTVGDATDLLMGLRNVQVLYLYASTLEVLKILKFGEVNDKTELEQIKHFLELMPHLEQLNIYYDTSVDDNLVKVSKQLQEIPGVASAKCKVQVISDNLTFSVTLPSSSSI